MNRRKWGTDRLFSTLPTETRDKLLIACHIYYFEDEAVDLDKWPMATY